MRQTKVIARTRHVTRESAPTTNYVNNNQNYKFAISSEALPPRGIVRLRASVVVTNALFVDGHERHVACVGEGQDHAVPPFDFDFETVVQG